MDFEDVKARIQADMATVPNMDLGAALRFLDGYSARFDAEISQGVVTRAAVRAYADEALQRANQEAALKRAEHLDLFQSD